MQTSPIVDACAAEFRKIKLQCEAALSQLADEQLHVRIHPQQNSVAVIVQHVAGNMLSRWTDFLHADGEKPTRDRESEFVERGLGRGELMTLWERGWAALFDALGGLRDADLLRTIHIRREPHTVIAALIRQLAHYSQHLGQIVLIGKQLRGPEWQYLSIPPGQSAAFNAARGMA